MASVVSAAVISGELIIGLDDGSIIRAGYVPVSYTHLTLPTICSV